MPSPDFTYSKRSARSEEAVSQSRSLDQKMEYRPSNLASIRATLQKTQWVQNLVEQVDTFEILVTGHWNLRLPVSWWG